MGEKVYPLVREWNPKLRRYEWVESEPDACPDGHPWDRPFTMRRGWQACTEHGGHRTWSCATPGCGQVVLDPPHEGETEPDRWEPMRS